TFDAVDGKQARRTSSSSPLGELFDHGIFFPAPLSLSLSQHLNLTVFKIFIWQDVMPLPALLKPWPLEAP
uniref:Uncharacterized protein n=1 Tax=Aegilops tauschii subsp. strangulata TaxID=200361 RepID=A0A453R2M1_AEGTS